MNHSFSMKMAHAMAERLANDAGNDDMSSRVKRAFQLSFERAPDGDELAAAIALVNEHGLRALCRALLNSSELIYVD